MSASAPGMGDGADEGADAAVVAAQLEDLLHHRAVLALELAGLGRGGAASGRSSTSTRRTPSGPAWAAPGTPRCSGMNEATPRPPMATRSVTSATTPTLA